MNHMQRTAIAFDDRRGATHHGSQPLPALAAESRAAPGVRIEVYGELAAAEALWRRFEPDAECTVFQTHGVLAAWQRHIGARRGVIPAVVVVRRYEPLCVLPVAIAPARFVRRLTWLGQDHCDYLAPLVARASDSALESGAFPGLWAEVLALLQSTDRFRHDVVDLRKMPEAIGSRPNPMTALAVQLNPSGAHLTRLFGDWEHFYAEKRSAATRRRDRTKRKRLAEFGELRIVDAASRGEIARTFDILAAQKSRALARMGAPDFLSEPGVREFFLDLATGPLTREHVHLSRLDIGTIPAAVNLGFQFRGRYYYVLASYEDGEQSRFGPGAAHLRDLLARAIALGLHEFDFTIGDERYKSEWADAETRLYDCFAASSPRGWPVALALRTAARVKRAIKQTPLLWRLASRLRALGRPPAPIDR